MEFPLDVCRAWSVNSGLGGKIKVTPADFIVEEIMDEDFSGEGEHLYLKIRKTGQNTHWVAEQLARLTDVRARDIGYAGRKDRLAVTTQWFSVPAQQGIKDTFAIEGCELLDVQQHARKLRPGDHQGNLFRIRVTHLSGDIETRSKILEGISSQGFPNYFGLQRFGRDGANLYRGWDALHQGRRLKGRQSGMYLSALRSWIFNRVLDSHLKAGHWDALCEQYPLWTGPLWGRGRNAPQACEEPIETEVVSGLGELCNFLEHSGLTQERRPLLARPDSFSVITHSPELLALEFALGKGQFATELLAELGVEEEG